MDIVTLRPFVAPLSGGPVTILPGTVLSSTNYSDAEWSAIIEASGGAPRGYLFYPSGSVVNEAAAECEALRLRGGDGDNASQGIMQTAVIVQWD